MSAGPVNLRGYSMLPVLFADAICSCSTVLPSDGALAMPSHLGRAADPNAADFRNLRRSVFTLLRHPVAAFKDNLKRQLKSLALVVVSVFAPMSDPLPPTLIFLGGFLGAGKTTLILKAVDLLANRGKRAAIITNDQGGGLVDTRHARALDVAATEVAGGCFCCRFSDLIDASKAIRVYRPDVIFAEPVGSCVDLSATILQPLKAFHRQSFRLAPLTVLIDPATFARIERHELGRDVEFLFDRQLAEADLICLSKQDAAVQTVRPPFPIDFTLSARTGFGVDAWLNEVLAAKRVVGARLLDIDYRRYAEAEAALGWLNLHAAIRLTQPASPAVVCGPLVDTLQEILDAEGMPIVHLKVFDQASTGWVKASVSSNGRGAVPEGDLLADPACEHELAINLRALADPRRLRSVVERSFSVIPGTVNILHLNAFRPAEPRPEHRFTTLQL